MCDGCGIDCHRHEIQVSDLISDVQPGDHFGKGLPKSIIFDSKGNIKHVVETAGLVPRKADGRNPRPIVVKVQRKVSKYRRLFK